MFYFSKELLIILKSLDDVRKADVVGAIKSRLKCPEKYKLLTMIFGILGFHRLYLKDTQGAWIRLNYFFAGLIAAGAGLFLSSFQLIGVSLVFCLIVLALWTFDLMTPQLAMKRYHYKIEARVTKWHKVQQNARLL